MKQKSATRRYIHFNDDFKHPHNLKSKGHRWPVLVVQQGDTIVVGNGAEIVDKEGNVVARICYDPINKMPSKHHDIIGWVETDLDVKIL